MPRFGRDQHGQPARGEDELDGHGRPNPADDACATRKCLASRPEPINVLVLKPRKSSVVGCKGHGCMGYAITQSIDRSRGTPPWGKTPWVARRAAAALRSRPCKRLRGSVSSI